MWSRSLVPAITRFNRSIDSRKRRWNSLSVSVAAPDIKSPSGSRCLPETRKKTYIFRPKIAEFGKDVEVPMKNRSATSESIG